MPVISGGASGGGGSVNSVTAGDTSITIGGTGADPTVKTADLATIAADHATSGSVAMGTNKLTGLAAGTTAGDSVRYEQALLTGAVTAADTSIVVGGTGVAPTIRTATLDVIAADHPPAAAVAMNAQKITGIANGSAASDAAAFGQLPASIGQSTLVYRYTVAGSDKASIDTGVDTPDAGSNNWTNGDLLEVFAVIRTDNVASNVFPTLVVNNDTGANYSRQRISGNNASPAAGFGGGETSWSFTAHGSGGTSGQPSQMHLAIAAYAATAFAKAGRLSADMPDATAANNVVEDWAVSWSGTAAISRLKLAAGGTDKLKIGTQLLIYKRLAS